MGLAAAVVVAAVTRSLDCMLVVADRSLDCIGCNFAARTEDMLRHIVAEGCSIAPVAVTDHNLRAVDMAVQAGRIGRPAGRYSPVG